ncbi:MAG: winged helix-turn-helix transcriptional regulator [Comamonadaceae bacterium]|nr:MAG: winged helix-turn-helix transcriptional regulator [Comamonadaceae bacterium]
MKSTDTESTGNRPMLFGNRPMIVRTTTGYVESWGRGIEKMRRECANHDAPAPIFDTSMSGLMLTFKANPVHLAAMGEHSGRATQEATQETTQETTQERICRLLRKEPELTRRELAEHLSLTPDGVKYHLEKLKASGRIRHVGPTKSGRWEVLK